jgi:glucan 1,4-alpha-glucosidase
MFKQKIKIKTVLLCLPAVAMLTIFLASCNTHPKLLTVTSPGEKLTVKVQLDEKGIPGYTLLKGADPIIQPSKMGFDIMGVQGFSENWKILDTSLTDFFETWEMPWGEKRQVNNNYRQLIVRLAKQDQPKYRMNIVFRVYDDGIGFRYEFPQQPGLDTVYIMEEHSAFALTSDHTCYWIPGDWDIYEHLYNTTRFTEIDAIAFRDHPNLAQTYIPHNAVNTPVTMKSDDGLYLSFHEAALTDYAGMTLKIDANAMKMTSCLVGSENTDYKVVRQVPFATPWRTIQVADRAGDLIESDLIVNLNEPNRLGDVSWVKPMKYIGIWWEMHLGKSSWDYSTREDLERFPPSGKPHGRHGATTENAMRYIDFAADNNIGGVLIEGWNTGWERWIGVEDREGIFDFVTSYPDYDLEKVVNYARDKGVEIIMHHETSSAVTTYEQQMDTAYRLMNSLGIHSVKTGYVGTIIPKGEYHHGQFMVNHYRRVLQEAARYQIAINAHEPIKATGIRRTYPNAITREGLRGQEFNAWASDGGNPPEHLPIVAFTRMLAGPIDYTPGIFNIKLEPYKESNQVNTTLAHQLALYVVIYSPVQMAADLPENYKNHPAFQFIREVPVDWEQTTVIDGEIGDYVYIARQERGRSNWFFGAITDENGRELELTTDFLEPGITYEATIYADADDAHWNDNPTAYQISKQVVQSGDVIKLKLKPGGGAAISFIAKI